MEAAAPHVNLIDLHPVIFFWVICSLAAGFGCLMKSDDLPGDTEEADVAIGIVLAALGPLTLIGALAYYVGRALITICVGFRDLKRQLFPPPPEPPVPVARDVSGGDA